jgi:hypothetical protein
LKKNCTFVFITLSTPYIRLVVVLSELAFDDDGVDVDSGKESIQKIVPILHIKIAMEKYSIHFLCSSLYDQFYNYYRLSLTIKVGLEGYYDDSNVLAISLWLYLCCKALCLFAIILVADAVLDVVVP